LTAWLAWSPEIALTFAGALVLVLDAVRPGTRKVGRTVMLAGVAAAATLAVLVALQSGALYGVYFDGSLRVDMFTTFGRLLFMAAGAPVILASWDTTGERDTSAFFALFAFSLLGESVIVGAQNLLLLFIGIELLALPTYALMAMRRRSKDAVRASLKYLLLGVFASIVMLYGVALAYGSLHTISYAAGLFPDPATLGTARTGLAMAAFLFLFIGLGFKTTAFPFHFWSPDVYSGGSTPVVAYVSTVPKVAVMLAIVRILGPSFATGYPVGRTFLAVLAVVSMVYGNVVALLQDDVRRMLAYSGVANTGYMLIALVTGTAPSVSALMFFLTVYTFANLGAFFVIMALDTHGHVTLADFCGLGRRSAPIAAIMAVCLFSLAGTPPMAGFFGKLAIFKAAVDSGQAWIALIGLVMTVVSVGYYLKIASSMYGDLAVRDTGECVQEPSGPVVVPRGLRIAMTATAVASVVLGVAGIGVFASMF
jgi:NADH-quinone oxidoreductase subunit N